MPRIALAAAVLAALVLGGCSLKQSGGGKLSAPPAAGARSGDANAAQQLGFPVTATRNTTRVSGSDPVADAAGVASALFPAGDASSRPPAVVLVDQGDWQGAVAAGALVGAPVRAPVLLTGGGSLPPVTEATIKRLAPGRAILIGEKPTPPSGLQSSLIRGAAPDPYSEAAAVDRFSSVARGKPSPDVVIASGEQAPFAMPAAPWAARSGDSVLFVKRDSIPPPTLNALREHQRPRIWVLGPESAVSAGVLAQLGKLGPTRRITPGPTAVENAAAFARFKSSGFGWGASVPGQNLTIANASRPADAAAAAGLGANGIFAPLLLTDQAAQLPRALEGYLLDVQPGYDVNNPGQGVFNHVWILGAADALSAQAQSRVDTDAALVPVDQAPSR